MNARKRRCQILEEMATIDCMEKGQLTEEYREGFQKGKSVRLGPYYKHQCWENGRNKSRRVPAHEVETLRRSVEGYHRFEALAQEYVEVTVAMTRQSSEPDSKKKRSSSPSC